MLVEREGVRGHDQVIHGKQPGMKRRADDDVENRDQVVKTTGLLADPARRKVHWVKLSRPTSCAAFFLAFFSLSCLTR